MPRSERERRAGIDAILREARGRFESLTPTLMRPKYSALDQARAVIERYEARHPPPPIGSGIARMRWNVRAASKAWAALLADGIVSRAWASDTAGHCFCGAAPVDEPQVGAPLWRTVDGAAEPLEPDVVLALASDQDGIQAVESLVQTFRSRMAPWHWEAGHVTRVCWRAMPETPPYEYRPWLMNLVDPMERALGLEDPKPDPYPEGTPTSVWLSGTAHPNLVRLNDTLGSELATFCNLSALWTRCASLPVPSDPMRGPAPVSHFDADRDPFAPVIDILARGYYLGGIRAASKTVDVFAAVPRRNT